MNRTKSIFVAAGFALAMVFTFSCDGGKSDLVGRWDLAEGPIKGNPEAMELLEDGTGIVDKAGITWKIEKDRFYMTHPLVAASWNYTISGSTLTFSNDGAVLKYKKKEQQTSFTDSRDGKTYRTAKMPDDKVWFMENLNYNVNGSKCHANNEGNCQQYGRLYDWGTAMSICPNGWHLPSDDEWTAFENAIGGISTAGRKLKAASGWDDYREDYITKSGNGNGAFGFAALPSGCSYNVSDNSDRRCGATGGYGEWWNATEQNSDKAYTRAMFSKYDNIRRDTMNKVELYSVRCIKD